MQLSPRREVGEFRKRYKWMVLTAIVVFSLLIARLAQLQLVQHDEWARIARENITKTISLPATRGILRDARGRIIAENRPSYVVYLTPQLLAPEDVARVAELMNLDETERAALQRRLDEIPVHRRTHAVLTPGGTGSPHQFTFRQSVTRFWSKIGGLSVTFERTPYTPCPFAST